MTKLLYQQGNLHKGNPYGVRVEKQFGSTELHGPFGAEIEAWNYGVSLARKSDGTESFSVVKIETPVVHSIATGQQVREHFANPDDDDYRREAHDDTDDD